MDSLAFRQGRICIVRNLGWLVVLVCTLEKKATEAAHDWRGHSRGRDAIQIVSGTLGQIDHVGVVLKVPRHGVAAYYFDGCVA